MNLRRLSVGIALVVLVAHAQQAQSANVTLNLASTSNVALRFGLFDDNVTDTASFAATGTSIQDVTLGNQAPFGTVVTNDKLNGGAITLSGLDNSYSLNAGFLGGLNVGVAGLGMSLSGPTNAFQAPPIAAGTTQFSLSGSSISLNAGSISFTGTGAAAALGTQTVTLSSAPLTLNFTGGLMTMNATATTGGYNLTATIPVNANTVFITTPAIFDVGILMTGTITATGFFATGGTTLVGDANGDCSVGAADYAIWAAQFGQSGASLSADFDHNGSVGAGDYTLWAANFGNTCAPGAGAASVPEPATIGMFALGLLSFGLLARRKRAEPR